MSIFSSAQMELWENRTEVIIGFCGFGFSLILLALYELSGQGAIMRDMGHWGGYAVMAYFGFCILRLLWVSSNEYSPVFGWLTALVDVVALSSILYVFGLQSDNSVAEIKSPAYTLYYVLIAMHAMRFNPALVLAMGLTSILASVLMSAALLDTTVNVVMPIDSAPAPAFMGAEVEKLLSLMMFVVLTAIAVMRAKTLLSSAGLKESAEIKAAEYQKSSREKAEIMLSMGQDLHEPMTDVSEMVVALRKTNLSAKQIEFIDIIEKSGGEILSIIDDIVDYTKLEMGELEISSEEFNLTALIEEVGDYLGPKARAKKLDLLTHVDVNSQNILVGDEGRIRKVLINLVDNAIKYTEEGSVLLSASSIPLNGEDAKLSLSVKDTGIGIAADRIDDVFNASAPADGSDKRRYGVMGLGLSVSRGIVRANGGDINVKSERGKGSDFSFDLRVPYKYQTNGKNSLFSGIKNIDKVQVLIVDDESTGAGLMQQKLNDIGLMPKIVTDAETACKAITAGYNGNKPFAFALIDFDMPGWDGLELAKLIRTRTQLEKMGLIILSTSEDPAVISGFSKAKASAYLTKPYRKADLENALLRVLKSPRIVTTAPMTKMSSDEQRLDKAG